MTDIAFKITMQYKSDVFATYNIKIYAALKRKFNHLFHKYKII